MSTGLVPIEVVATLDRLFVEPVRVYPLYEYYRYLHKRHNNGDAGIAWCMVDGLCKLSRLSGTIPQHDRECYCNAC